MVGCCQETRRRDARSGVQRVGTTRDGVCGTGPLPLRRWERLSERRRLAAYAFLHIPLTLSPERPGL